MYPQLITASIASLPGALRYTLGALLQAPAVIPLAGPLRCESVAVNQVHVGFVQFVQCVVPTEVDGVVF